MVDDIPTVDVGYDVSVTETDRAVEQGIEQS